MGKGLNSMTKSHCFKIAVMFVTGRKGRSIEIVYFRRGHSAKSDRRHWKEKGIVIASHRIFYS